MNFHYYIKIYHLLLSACPKKEDISETGRIKEPVSKGQPFLLWQKQQHLKPLQHFNQHINSAQRKALKEHQAKSDNTKLKWSLQTKCIHSALFPVKTTHTQNLLCSGSDASNAGQKAKKPHNSWNSLALWKDAPLSWGRQLRAHRNAACGKEYTVNQTS